MIGKTISHYKILEKLGEGGMGVVYRAHDTKLDRDVALKFLPHYLTSDANEKERFYHEARAASALNHPNITTIYEIQEHEQQVFIAMEFVEGDTLKNIVGAIHESPLQLNKILDIAIKICEGLAAAHEKGIVHRDIKSENIILTPKGQAKIMDFGLAKVKGATKLTKAGSTLGTAAYMSPEQARGEEVDHRSDIFSFGVVLYELLTSKLPFRGEHHAALMYSIINEEPQPIARFNEKVTPEIERIVAKALAKDKDERYQHADELLADLRRERKQMEYAKVSHVDESRPRVASTSKPRYSKQILCGIIVIVIIVLAIILKPFSRETEQNRKSIAVLPFKNMSDSKEDEYFSDGITEDIITQLSKIADIKVISRTATMKYKQSEKGPKEIGNELNVATVLEGSVRREGNRVRIVAQLIDAQNEGHIWADTYDKEMDQIFYIQSDVAQRIAMELKAKLSPSEKERIEKKQTENLEAYSYYLKGREYYSRYHKQDNETAIELFKKAKELDSNYALPYAGLGDAYGQRVLKFGFTNNWLDSGMLVCNRAIKIDQSCAEAYKALGLIYENRGLTRKAVDALEKSISLNPNYFPAVQNIGFIKISMGDLADGWRWMMRTVKLNPNIGFQYHGVGVVYAYLTNDFKSELWFKKAINLQPDFLHAYAGLGTLYLAQANYQQALQQGIEIRKIDSTDINGFILIGCAKLFSGALEEARQEFNKAIEVSPQTGSEFAYGNTKIALGCILWKKGNYKDAKKLLDESMKYNQKLINQGSESYVPRNNLAAIYAILNNKQEAYRWLRLAFDAGWRLYRLTSIDPSFENLRNEEQFKNIIAQMKTKVDEQRRLVEEMEKNQSVND
jgi:serine/threonine protein kinase/Flp pilus assembly protein TadD